MHPFLQFVIGLALAGLGAAHWLPATRDRFAEHYERQWGGERGVVQHRVAGVVLVLAGLGLVLRAFLVGSGE